MAMNRIGRPPIAQPNVLERFRNSGGKREVESGHDNQPATPGNLAGYVGDRVEISDRARKLADMKQALVAGRRALAEVPDVRQDRIAQARTRLHTGYYHSEDVRKETAARLGSVLRKLEEL